MLAHCAIGIELPETGGLCAGAAERIEHQRRIQSHERSRSDCSAERGRGASWMPEPIVARVHRLTDAQSGFVAERHRKEKGLAIGMLALGDREGGWNDSRGRVYGRSLVDV